MIRGRGRVARFLEQGPSRGHERFTRCLIIPWTVGPAEQLSQEFTFVGRY